MKVRATCDINRSRVRFSLHIRPGTSKYTYLLIVSRAEPNEGEFTHFTKKYQRQEDEVRCVPGRQSSERTFTCSPYHFLWLVGGHRVLVTVVHAALLFHYLLIHLAIRQDRRTRAYLSYLFIFIIVDLSGKNRETVRSIPRHFPRSCRRRHIESFFKILQKFKS